MKSHIRPFWFALVTAIALIFIGDIWTRHHLSGIAQNITSETMFYLAHEKDDHGHLVKKSLLNAKQQNKEKGKSLYVIGGSTLREGLLKDRIIQNDYIDASDPKLRFVSYYSFDQNLAETARIALSQEIKSGDVVVINLNPRRLGFAPDTLNQELSLSRLSMLPEAELYPLINKLEGRWPELKTPKMAELSLLNHRLFAKQWIKGRLPGQTKTSWGHLSQMNFGDVKTSKLIDLKPRKIRRYLRYAYGSKALSQDEKVKIAQRVKTLRVKDYKDNHAFGFDLLKTLTQILTQRGANVVFLDLPRSELSQNAYAEIWDDYNTKLGLLAQESGAARIDLRSLPIPQEHYYDLEHIMKPSRPALTDALIEALKADGWVKP